MLEKKEKLIYTNPEDEKTKAWKNLLAEYGPRVISESEYKKVRDIPPEAAGHFVVSEAIACRECGHIVKAKLEPFIKTGVLENCIVFGLCQEHSNDQIESN